MADSQTLTFADAFKIALPLAYDFVMRSTPDAQREDLSWMEVVNEVQELAAEMAVRVSFDEEPSHV